MRDGNNLLLQTENLKIYFYLDEGILKAVNGVNLKIQRGKTLGLVGESGCGKSVTAQSILRITPHPGKIEGKIFFYQKEDRNSSLELVKLSPSGEKIRSIRGKEITIVFQEPMTSFSPIHTIGDQIMEAILLHRTKNKKKAREIALEMLYKVGIPNPCRRIDEYPHQISGGMRQRSMIAMALSCNPSLLIADEPTTALDVTIQAQVLELMKDLQAEFGMSILYITHNMGVIAEMADVVGVMYLGKIIEEANVEDIFSHPLHPYTKALLISIPRVGKKTKARLYSIKGTISLPIGLPEGCAFYPRCPKAKDGICNVSNPPLIEVKKEHKVRCFLYT